MWRQRRKNPLPKINFSSDPLKFYSEMFLLFSWSFPSPSGRQGARPQPLLWTLCPSGACCAGGGWGPELCTRSVVFFVFWAENEEWRVRRGEGRVQSNISQPWCNQHPFLTKTFTDIIVHSPCSCKDWWETQHTLLPSFPTGEINSKLSLFGIPPSFDVKKNKSLHPKPLRVEGCSPWTLHRLSILGETAADLLNRNHEALQWQVLRSSLAYSYPKAPLTAFGGSYGTPWSGALGRQGAGEGAPASPALLSQSPEDLSPSITCAQHSASWTGVGIAGAPFPHQAGLASPMSSIRAGVRPWHSPAQGKPGFMPTCHILTLYSRKWKTLRAWCPDPGHFIPKGNLEKLQQKKEIEAWNDQQVLSCLLSVGGKAVGLIIVVSDSS